MRDIFGTIRSIFGALFVIFALISVGMFLGSMREHADKVRTSAILVLDLEGIIIDGKRILEEISDYADDEHIKGILVRINSPGGVVGPSQEIFAELKRVREVLKKPVVVTCGAVMASGAYYAAVAADKIVTNPGCLMGSIGVIMEFANLERLYDWAKVERYALKTGPYKDAGADYRKMNNEERALFQGLIDNVQAQFKTAVAEGRKLDPTVVDKYADGRVFTGAMAVELGFADVVGTYRDALKIIGEMSGLGDDPEIFEPPERHPNFWSMVSDIREESSFKGAVDTILPRELLAKPLYLLPGTVRF